MSKLKWENQRLELFLQPFPLPNLFLSATPLIFFLWKNSLHTLKLRSTVILYMLMDPYVGIISISNFFLHYWNFQIVIFELYLSFFLSTKWTSFWSLCVAAAVSTCACGNFSYCSGQLEYVTERKMKINEKSVGLKMMPWISLLISYSTMFCFNFLFILMYLPMLSFFSHALSICV